MKYCLIFKSSDELEGPTKDPYVERLEKSNIKCHLISVLKFEFINLNELKVKLSKPDNYSGIVYSSPRCVKAVSLSVEDFAEWKRHKFFVVGEKTGKLVEKEFGVQTEGGHCGNAKSLAEYIIKQNITKPLLIPTGNLSRKILPNILVENGIKFDQIIVYNTLTDPNIESYIKEAFNTHTIRYVLYFSPSAVEATFPIFIKHNLNMSDIKWGAIGPTTKDALKEQSIEVSIVPENPTPEDFGKAFDRALESEN